MHFEYPLALYFLVVPLLLIILAARKKAYRAILSLNSLMLLLLILAVANPLQTESTKSNNIALLVDISDSIDTASASALLTEAKNLSKNASNVALYSFGKDVKGLGNLKPYTDLAQIRNQSTEISTNNTNLERALQSASASANNIIIISDGYQNQGDIYRAMQGLGSRVFPLVPQSGALNTQEYFGLASLEVPQIAESEKSVQIRSAISNNTKQAQSGRISVFHDEKEICSKTVNLSPSSATLVNCDSDPSKAGIRKIRSLFTPSDKSLPASEKIAYLSTLEPETILLLSGTQEDERLLMQALDGKTFKISRSFQAPLEKYSSVILNNIAHNELSDELRRTLPGYVKNGGGLLMIGGNKSFGLGGYIGTQIADLLPVELVPPQAKQKRLTVAVQLIIDKSRSMADDSKLDYAKEAAREVVRLLKDDDMLGVIGFDSSPFEVVRLAKLSEIRNSAVERIGRLFPAQKTNLFPALDEGRRRLVAAQTARKHMIVLTDGKIPDADQSYIELVKGMRLAGITVSTVMIGSDYDFGFLKSMADKGGGAYYQTNDPSNLPRIFLQDVSVKSGEKTMQEQKEFPVSNGRDGIISASIKEYPDLLGFIETRPKEQSKQELIVRSNQEDFPLYSSWNQGEGKVAAFTSDANGRWSRPWAQWSGFIKFWTEIIDSFRAKSSQTPLRYQLNTSIDGDSLVLDIYYFEDIALEKLATKLIIPNQGEISPQFKQVKSGHLQARIPTNKQSGYYQFSGEAGEKLLPAIGFEVSADKFSEKSGMGFNYALLEDIAQKTQGKINPSISDLEQQPIEIKSDHSLRNHLIAIALLLYLLGIILREYRIALLDRIKLLRLN